MSEREMKGRRWRISEIQRELRACVKLPFEQARPRAKALLASVAGTGISAGKFVHTTYSCAKCGYAKKVRSKNFACKKKEIGLVFSLFEWLEFCRVHGKRILTWDRGTSSSTSAGTSKS